jgi:hypothetical protein
MLHRAEQYIRRLVAVKTVPQTAHVTWTFLLQPTTTADRGFQGRLGRSEMQKPPEIQGFLCLLVSTV